MRKPGKPATMSATLSTSMSATMTKMADMELDMVADKVADLVLAETKKNVQLKGLFLINFSFFCKSKL